jgi:hypothetical protein
VQAFMFTGAEAETESALFRYMALNSSRTMPRFYAGGRVAPQDGRSAVLHWSGANSEGDLVPAQPERVSLFCRL